MMYAACSPNSPTRSRSPHANDATRDRNRTSMQLGTAETCPHLLAMKQQWIAVGNSADSTQMHGSLSIARLSRFTGEHFVK
jgi:hypothetical protein